MNINEFLKMAYNLQDEHPAWRWGQTLFNTLHRINPDLANTIRGSDIDPFYCAPDSDTEHKFWEWLLTKIDP